MRRRRAHGRDCRHCPRVRQLGREFQCWRASWEDELEHVSNGYATEARQFAQQSRPPTFKSYLIQMTGSGWPMSGSYT